MKIVFTSAVTSFFVAVVSFYWLQLAEQSSDDYNLDPTSATLAMEMQVVRKSLEKLQINSRKIRDEVATKGGQGNLEGQPPVSEAEYDKLADRIETLEDSIEDLSSSNRSSGGNGIERLEMGITKLSNESGETAVSNHYSGAESYFEEHSGVPLGTYTESIDRAVHALDHIEVQDMNCTDSICRVAYSKVEPLDSEEGIDTGLELVDKLSQEAVGKNVEIRYARDFSGNEVMYIYLQQSD